MKILMINGSPKGRRSNTYQLSSAFVEGIKNSTDTEYEELNVNSLNIKPCIGCFSCWNKTPGQCIVKDDMEEILKKNPLGRFGDMVIRTVLFQCSE